MIASGRETGKLDKVLAKVSNYYDREVETSIKSATSMIEPISSSAWASSSAASPWGFCSPSSSSASRPTSRGQFHRVSTSCCVWRTISSRRLCHLPKSLPPFPIDRRCFWSMRSWSGANKKIVCKRPSGPRNSSFRDIILAFLSFRASSSARRPCRQGAVLLSSQVIQGERVPVAGRLNDVKFKKMVRPGRLS